MPGRDDFGSRAGTPGGMGGSLGNGGVGGGMGGGMRGGGAGYNGGIGSRMGVTTGNVMRGTSAYGRPGGMAQGYGMNPAQARQSAMQGIMGMLQGRAQPTGAQPPQSPPPLPTSAWLKAYGNINSPIATGWAYSPGDMTGARPMQDYPRYQSQPQRLAPGQPKIQDRLPGNVGPGNWAGQASDPRAISGQNWGNPGAGSMGLGSSGGGRAGGGGRGW